MKKYFFTFIGQYSIFIYNAPVNESYKYSVVETGNIFLQKSHLVNTTDEPNISAAIFSLEKNLYNESLAYNTFYNRKAFIDQHGNVFNTARYINSFGNIKNKPLSAIIASDNFKEFWTVKKDVINVCKDCEFRHMCVDARVPVKRKKDEWFFPIECNYNPYIGKWKGTTGFKTLGECGIICNQDEFSIDMNVLLSESVVP